MCLAVYIASDHPLPLVPWNEKQRQFNVVPLTRYESEIKKQFRYSNIVYAGSHQGCGCGFIKEGESGEELAVIQANYDSLISYLEAHTKKGAAVEIFSCWEGDQGSDPEYRRTVPLNELGSCEFEFKEKAFYEIV